MEIWGVPGASGGPFPRDARDEFPAHDRSIIIIIIIIIIEALHVRSFFWKPCRRAVPQSGSAKANYLRAVLQGDFVRSNSLGGRAAGWPCEKQFFGGGCAAGPCCRVAGAVPWRAAGPCRRVAL